MASPLPRLHQSPEARPRRHGNHGTRGPPGVPSHSLTQEGWNNANDPTSYSIKILFYIRAAEQLTSKCLCWEVRFIPSLLWDDNLIINCRNK